MAIERKTLFLKGGLTELLVLDDRIICRRPAGHSQWSEISSAAEREVLQGQLDAGAAFELAPSAEATDVDRIMRTRRDRAPQVRSSADRIAHAHALARGEDAAPSTPSRSTVRASARSERTDSARPAPGVVGLIKSMRGEDDHARRSPRCVRLLPSGSPSLRKGTRSMVELIDNVLLVRELTGRSADAATRDRLENRILDLSQAEQAVESKFVKQQLDYLMRFPRTPNRDAP